MPVADNRLLAAILFADIAGYTALMQEDEQEAVRKLKRFRAGIEQIVPEHSGRIVQFYGDGCLLIFQSVLNAVRCSIALQEAFMADPSVPVRMGAHQGEVILEDENIYGSSVNLAARVESMSVPGAVLISEKIQDEIRNRPDIATISLGHFDFKNVQEPMQVFALQRDGLAVPEQGEITGKFKDQNRQQSIAVLPFENRSSDPEQEYFSDGISEEIIYGLAQVENLKVAGRASSFVFKGSGQAPVEIAKQLQVEKVLTGSVRTLGKRVRVGVQLINGSDGFEIWTKRYDRQVEDIFGIQDEIADQVVGALKINLLGHRKKQPLIRHRTEAVEAYRLYLQGRSYLDQRTHVDAALACFEEALAIDPDFADAHTSIAYAYFYRVVFGNYAPRLGFPKAEAAVQAALQLDPHVAEAQTMYGLVRFYYHYQWDEAQAHYERALVLQPNLADTYRVKAYYHSMILQLEEAVQCAEKAHQIEPMSFNNIISLADIYYRARRYAEAVQVLIPLVAKYPLHRMAREMLGTCHYLLGDMDRAREAFAGSTEMPVTIHLYSAARFVFALQDGQQALFDQYLAHLHAMQERIWISPTAFALAYFARGDIPKALAYYDEALAQKDPGLIYVNVDPLWARFRGLAQVQEILQRIGLIRKG